MTLGVIGGLGPLATACFMEMVVRMTDARRDQDHLNMILYSCPGIPDRTAYILGESKENPLPEIVRIGRRLAEDGADLIAIPCITAHYFHRELSDQIPLPVIDAPLETARALKRAGIRRAGILATDGTIRSGLFQTQLASLGIEPVIPDPEHQRMVMDVIYDNVKTGRPVDRDKFDRSVACLREQGTEAVILGCTELSLVKRDCDPGPGFLDAMEVLAKCSIVRCGGRLKREYDTLI